ncbi:hypothetical protein L2U69_07835 [Zavarzinia compransoris]|uniref:hypothetical protein n=1 Tax=Zavarzinia marina TaxID=2911065 RepID=UPI001F18F3E6|nr:hypothetical protein [Zavarzinia marina]MCF4165548.1 hypothetical protein [Zavarzinia marina]
MLNRIHGEGLPHPKTPLPSAGPRVLPRIGALFRRARARRDQRRSLVHLQTIDARMLGDVGFERGLLAGRFRGPGLEIERIWWG